MYAYTSYRPGFRALCSVRHAPAPWPIQPSQLCACFSSPLAPRALQGPLGTPDHDLTRPDLCLQLLNLERRSPSLVASQPARTARSRRLTAGRCRSSKVQIAPAGAGAYWLSPHAALAASKNLIPGGRRFSNSEHLTDVMRGTAGMGNRHTERRRKGEFPFFGGERDATRYLGGERKKQRNKESGGRQHQRKIEMSH